MRLGSGGVPGIFITVSPLVEVAVDDIKWRLALCSTYASYAGRVHGTRLEQAYRQRPHSQSRVIARLKREAS